MGQVSVHLKLVGYFGQLSSKNATEVRVSSRPNEAILEIQQMVSLPQGLAFITVINGEIYRADSDLELRDGDEIVLVPITSGG